MTDLQRIARDIVFGGNLSNADAVLLWERLTGFKVRQARRCEKCDGNGTYLHRQQTYLELIKKCKACNETGYVGGFTPRDAEGQVGAMVEAVKGGGK